MPINRALLARTRDRIAEVGDDHCNMNSYLSGPHPGLIVPGLAMPGAGLPECGTTACIAGHALAIERGTFTQADAVADFAGAAAADLLGLPTAVFYDEEWPERFRQVLLTEGHAKGMLAVCDALLDGTVSPDEFGSEQEASF